MGIEIREVTSKSDIRKFVELPFKLYKGNPNWVPPIKSDERKSLDPSTNPAYKICDAKFCLAYRDSEVVGRIGAIINHPYNQKTGEKLGRFTRMEFIDDREVSSKLFETAEGWIKLQGMTGVLGPLGFTNLDNQGLLIEGFDHLQSVASVYHLPYYQEHIESLGYQKEIDWVEFRLKISEIPEKALKLNDVIKKRYGFEVLHFDNSKQLKPYAKEVFRLLNKAFDELPFVSAFDDELIDFYVKKYFTLLNPHLVKVVKNQEGELVGFIIGLPSLSEALQKANGKVFPFGIFHILKALKKPKVMDLLLTGIDPHLQGQGVAALLITEQQQTMLKYGIEFTETTGIFETNQKAIQNWKNYEHIQHKRRRCYRKMLEAGSWKTED